ncbi:hypothetical protein GJ496_009606 [Pomphorhynchus laevis]|nr:hypothetical protein GJ496_009606 [Pomphorhynchus laevis]
MKFEHQTEIDFENRCAEAERIMKKFPDRVPVIVEKLPNSNIPKMDKKKFLVPADISVAQFMWIIRRRIVLSSEQAIFLFIDNSVPQASSTMGQLYSEFKNDDGFLYIAYSGENTFGASI